MSNDHSMFFVIEKSLWTIRDKKKINVKFSSGCLLSRVLDNSSRTKMNSIFKSCCLCGFLLKY